MFVYTAERVILQVAYPDGLQKIYFYDIN